MLKEQNNINRIILHHLLLTFPRKFYHLHYGTFKQTEVLKLILNITSS